MKPIKRWNWNKIGKINFKMIDFPSKTANTLIVVCCCWLCSLTLIVDCVPILTVIMLDSLRLCLMPVAVALVCLTLLAAIIKCLNEWAFSPSIMVIDPLIMLDTFPLCSMPTTDYACFARWYAWDAHRVDCQSLQVFAHPLRMGHSRFCRP